MEEKKFNEQVKNHIKQVCESGKYNIDFNEFDIDVSFNVEHHRKYHFVFENVFDLTYETKLIEKDKKFSITVNSSVNPKYIAEYAVFLYEKEKYKYKEKQIKEKEEKESKKKSFFDRLFGK